MKEQHQQRSEPSQVIESGYVTKIRTSHLCGNRLLTVELKHTK